MRKLALSAALILTAAIFGISTPGTASADSFKVAFSTWVGYGPLYVALDKGYFKDEGVDVELVKMDDPKLRFTALLAGRIDMLATTVDTMVLYLKTPDAISFICPLDDSNGGDGIVANKDIKTIADLKGKKVAIGVKGSGDDLLAIRILKNYGITTDNTPFQFIGRSDAQNALANHQLDAVAMPYARNNRGHLGPVFAARPVGKSTDFAIPDADKNDAFLASDKTFFLDKLGEPAFGRPDLVGIAFYQGMAIRADLSDDLVYRMTKALYENWDQVLKGAPWWDAPGEASLESAPAFTTVPYHPGAVRYYKEKGVWAKYHK